jgi:suppressor for copper-sensitivity B
MLLPNLQISRYQDSVVMEEVGQPQAIGWQMFDRSAIAPLVGDGKVVFVDVTADWCLTCKFNKLRVLNREPVMPRLRQENIVAMRADLTRPIREYGRYGIPFNIVYGPAAPEGILLSELLESDEVIRAIERAAGK